MFSRFQAFKLFALWLCLATFSAMSYAQTADPPVRYYVAPNGNDQWTGRSATRKNNDGPFATLSRARDALRADRANLLLPRGATVSIAGGTYFLAEPLIFTSQDSGSQNAPILYATARGQRAIFSGGQRLNNWKKVGERWETVLPEVRAGKWNFIQLWRNNERKARPRWPEQGYNFIDHTVEPSPQSAGKGHDRFGFKTGDVKPDFHNPADIDFLMMQVWTMARMKAQNIDFEKREVTFSSPTRTLQWYGSFPKGNRYILENVREALAPGQWYLDRKTGVLTYWPLPNETPQNSQFIAPRLESLVEFRGTEDKPISDISLQGLSFQHSNWATPDQGNANIQAEVDIPAAIRAVNAQRIRLQDCEISHIGHYAVSFGRACHDNQLLNCRLGDLGAGGVKIGETGNSDDAQSTCR